MLAGSLYDAATGVLMVDPVVTDDGGTACRRSVVLLAAISVDMAPAIVADDVAARNRLFNDKNEKQQRQVRRPNNDHLQPKSCSLDVCGISMLNKCGAAQARRK